MAADKAALIAAILLSMSARDYSSEAGSRSPQSLLRQYVGEVRGARGGRRMRDEDSGCALALDALAQQREHFPRAFRIEIAGRFVGEHQARLVHQGARDRDALHLAARELVGHALAALAQLHRIEQRADPPAHALVPDAVQRERERDVLLHA